MSCFCMFLLRFGAGHQRREVGFIQVGCGVVGRAEKSVGLRGLGDRIAAFQLLTFFSL
jgi:hypothetical protein